MVGSSLPPFPSLNPLHRLRLSHFLFVTQWKLVQIYELVASFDLALACMCFSHSVQNNAGVSIQHCWLEVISVAYYSYLRQTFRKTSLIQKFLFDESNRKVPLLVSTNSLAVVSVVLLCDNLQLSKYLIVQLMHSII